VTGSRSTSADDGAQVEAVREPPIAAAPRSAGPAAAGQPPQAHAAARGEESANAPLAAPSRLPAVDARLPLSGIRVLDLGVVLAGPQAALLLADLGAEVIRIESTQYFPPQTRGIFAHPTEQIVKHSIPISGGYPNREPGERPWNRFPWFNTHARNKLGMTVDLQKPEGVAIVRRLAAVSDVLLSNQSPGTLDRLGLGYVALAEENPALVYVEASSFGASGPAHDYRALGLQMEAFAGHDLLRHYRDRDVSSNTWAVTADAAGALGMALAAQMALYARRRSGRGQYIDLSMVENFVGLIGPHVLDFTVNGRVPKSTGNRHYSAVQGCYPCMGTGGPSSAADSHGRESDHLQSQASQTSPGGPSSAAEGRASQTSNDRWLVLTLPDDAAWQAFCRASGYPSGCDDLRFATVASRLENHDAIDELIAGWTRTLPREEAVARLQAEGVMAGPVLDDADAMADPHLAARGFFWEIDQADTGRHRYPGMPYRFANARPGVRQPPILLGEHNEQVYKELLGISEAEYERLTAAGHIGMEYAPHIK
jgi:crotonobetainyl-CoA:carnitine CoA-transferase CaiB-like acyl-CoA transferase